MIIILTELHNPIAKHLFETCTERIEFWSKATYMFFIIFIVPLVTVGLNVATFFLYFAMDMGEDSFIVIKCLW